MRVTAAAHTVVMDAGDVVAGDAQNLELKRLLQAMRGRYRLAVTLLLVGATIGSLAGFKLGKRLYASNGLIRVMAVVPKVLFSVDDKGTLPMFDSFVESQVALLCSQRVMDLAMQDPAWQSLGRGTSDRAAEEFAQHLSVTHDGEIIRVQMPDPDPKAAMTEVSTLINAYRKIYNDQDAESDERRIEILQSRKTTLSADLANKRQQILDIAKAYGSDDLKSLYDFKQSQVNKLDDAIAEKQMLLSSTARKSGTTRPSQARASVYELTASSPALVELLHEQRGYERQLEGFKAQKLMPDHPQVLQVQSLLDATNKDIEELVERLQAERASGSTVVTGSGSVVDEQTIDEEVKSLQGLRDNMHSDLMTLGQQMLQIEELRTEATEVLSDRDETQHRIDQLTLEATVSGRIDEISDGDRPLMPFKDTRPAFSAAGGFAGGMLGFAIVVAAAFMDRRLRSPDQAAGGRLDAPMLGLLPRLPEGLDDAEQVGKAAHCVGEIRALLQIWGRANRHRVFAVTSPDPGAGKTSLTLALGASYATSGLRTLVVDCDLIGNGLTRRSNAIVNRKLGQILRHEGLVTEAQLSKALEYAAQRKQLVGEALLEQGDITPEQLDLALRLQEQEPVGILDAIRGEELGQCIAESGIHNLKILPVGAATSRDIPL